MMKYLSKIILLSILPILSFSQDREADSLILVSIYQSLDGDNWPQNENWLSEAPLEDWKGVKTNNNRVNVFELKSTSAAGISGTFPLDVFGLTELQTLEFSYVDFNEPLPESIIQLTKLKRLVISNCNINGDLPQVFDQFENLATLILSFNTISGALPALPQNMNIVYLDRNQFSGALPASWEGNSMGALQIHENNLSGNYDIINTMPNLNKINLSYNDWDENTLPIWIHEINNLERFSCDGCNIIGEIPEALDFSNQELYSGMFLSENNLSGDISLLFNNPDFGKKLFLRVRSNNFSGELPVHKIESFHELDVYNNRYTSMTDPTAGTTYSLEIQYNNFTYESLEPLKEYIDLDSIIGVKYRNQNAVGNPDTLYINSSTTVTILANDYHPNTSYQWYKNNQIIEDESEAELNLHIDDNAQSGLYHCRMTNEAYPELDLRTAVSNLVIDLSTETKDLSSIGLKLSPIPASNTMYIEGLKIDRIKYEIRNFTGATITSDYSSGSIDISLLNPGIYLLLINNENKIFTAKFIKE